MRCPICDRFLHTHSDEEARWCYQLFLDREVVVQPKRKRLRVPRQTAWLAVPLRRDSVQQ